MKVRPLLIVNTIVITAMIGLSLWISPTIPEDALLPTHWNIDGEPDGHSSKWMALVFLPALSVVITLVFLLAPYLDPRRENLRLSAKFWNAVAIGAVLLMAAIHAVMIANVLGHPVDIRNVILPGIGALFIVIGNYLGKTRPNWFGGVRTPWTMSSDYSWEKTHRWAGRLFVLAGLATIATWGFADGKIAFIVMISGAIIVSLIPIVLSYIFWRNDPDRATGA